MSNRLSYSYGLFSPPLPAQQQISILCEDECKPLYNEDGEYAMTGDTPNFELCSLGKNAANAMVARKSFVGSIGYNTLMAGLGLDSAMQSTISDNSLTDEETVGLWSSDAERLYKLEDAATDAGFKEFFESYDNFRAIRNSDVGVPCSCSCGPWFVQVNTWETACTLAATSTFTSTSRKTPGFTPHLLPPAMQFMGEEVKVCVPRNDEALKERCYDGTCSYYSSPV